MTRNLIETAETDNLTDALYFLSGAKAVGVDTETTSLSPREGVIRLIQLSDGTPGRSYAIDVWEEPQANLARLREILEDPKVLKILQNAKFDMQFFKYQYDIDVWPVFDTMIAGQILRNEHNTLQWLAKQYLGETLGKEEQKSDWSKSLRKEQVEYARKDAEILVPLARVLRKEIRDSNQSEIARIEFNCLPAVVQLELSGIKIDQEKLSDLRIKTRQKRRKALLAFESAMPDDQAIQLGLGDFDPAPRLNLGSPKQVKEAFARAGIEPENTKAATLKTIDHPMAEALLDHRRYSKWLSSFLEPYPDLVHPKTGRIHASFNQTVVVTGRFSCSEPNLQQVPVRDTPEFRKMFIPEPGNVLVSCDYNAQEMRVLAELSGEPVLIEAFEQGTDIHKVAASRIFGKDMDDITKPERSRAKTLQFGLLYGRGAKALATDLKIPEEEAQDMIDTYFAQYPYVNDWIRKQRRFAEDNGYVLSIMGRRIPVFLASETKSWRREAVNYPIQGSSADMMKVAMGKVYQYYNSLDKIGPDRKVRMVNVVHDELLVECPEWKADEVAGVIKGCMEDAGNEMMELVECVADVSWGREWVKD